MSYANERRIAELAIQRACLLTERVYNSQVKGTITKGDKSPVTIADFGAQALIISSIAHAFPEDSVVGEEDSSGLRADQSKRDLVWGLVKDTLDATKELTAELGKIKDDEEMLAVIDKGTHQGGSVGRIWALDPIDGTKGFLRGGQYAVCLGFMVDGKVQVGALVCPNLPVDPEKPEGEKGILLSAIRGEGATMRPLSAPSAQGTPISMSSITDFSKARFCEGVEAGHSSHSEQASIAKSLGITAPSIQMDSQAKYASISRGVGEIYLRLPTSMTYEEKIWDHAAGSLIVEEAGGVVTDIYGKELDFTQGRTLKTNKGIVAALKALHPTVLKAVQEELKVSKL
ncbi:3(2),5-bisphosphate nucleotidase HAL2 [Choiromyces venosus 120613-1]|uniref:3'(2'),5'-bisphosphate nucleotidase n=1 Tax=Choiromyces venosus 120613-1 TaxID=1336337 RepID=A0A3N4JI32_9PEZI|nr:3(2),5-bisphosphate nucleotidase HAL2 [Choiromyces venosus 120613-1]